MSSAVSINPATGKEIRRTPFLTKTEVEKQLIEVDGGFLLWRETPIEKRTLVLFKMAEILRRDKNQMSMLITLEMGKPIAQAQAEIEKCAMLCEWYGEHGPKMLRDEPTSIVNGQAYVSYLPLGAVFAVMPWNFPFWQVMRGAVAILLGGNAYILKHSTNVLGSAESLSQAWSEAGLPKGVFSVFNVDHDLASDVIAHKTVAAVTVTGSMRAGRAVAMKAGSVLKKCVLELGGSDAFIVLRDADILRAAKVAVQARFQNTGQVCIAAKRFIVEKSILKKFTDAFLHEVSQLKMGDPTHIETFLGPMAREDLRLELHRQVEKCVTQGARVLTGGRFSSGSGFFYEPTVLSGVRPGMTCFEEEVFGPVASLVEADDSNHALDLANLSEFGLSGAIWTEDLDLARQMARRFETGGVFINGMSVTDPRVPVGGIKNSGLGRELSHFGLHEFLNAQTVWIGRTEV